MVATARVRRVRRAQLRLVRRGLTFFTFLVLVDVSFADQKGRRILEAARDAISRTQSFRYEFEYLGAGMASGRLTGRAELLRQNDLTDSYVRVSGHFDNKPPGIDAPDDFVFSTDGKRVWLRDAALNTARSEDLASRASVLALPSLYGILQEFVDSDPFWMELKSSQAIEYLGATPCGAGTCEIVLVQHAGGAGTAPTETFWHIDRVDHLPRRQARVTDVRGHNNFFDLVLHEVEAGPALAPEDFSMETALPARHESAGTEQAAAAIELRTVDGKPFRLADLRGRIVVLDFWASWCVLCKSLTPGVDSLASQFAGEPVDILGINIWETGDPVRYWREKGFRHRLVLQGDSLAEAFGVLYTPAVVVLGPDGRVVYAEHGTSGTRNRKLEGAVAAQLELLASRRN